MFGGVKFPATGRPTYYEEIMKRVLVSLTFGAFAIALAQTPASAQAAPLVTLTRLDCGTNTTPTDVAPRFSDTYAWPQLMI
jgi:N-acyl homoserine lactone hydrolase